MRGRAKLLGWLAAGGVAAALGAPSPALAQQGGAAPAKVDVKPLQAGDVAPDFSMPGATRWGVLAEPVRLSDYKGKTVVLSFFVRARTKG